MYRPCSQIPLSLGQTQFKVDLYLLPIYGADLVLGVQWLVELGEVLFDYRNLYMKFIYKEAQVQLQGMKPAQLSQMSMTQLKRVGQTEAIVSLFQIELMPSPEPSSLRPSSAPPETAASLQSLLNHFHSIFADPKRFTTSSTF